MGAVQRVGKEKIGEGGFTPRASHKLKYIKTLYGNGTKWLARRTNKGKRGGVCDGGGGGLGIHDAVTDAHSNNE